MDIVDITNVQALRGALARDHATALAFQQAIDAQAARIAAVNPDAAFGNDDIGQQYRRRYEDVGPPCVAAAKGAVSAAEQLSSAGVASAGLLDETDRISAGKLAEVPRTVNVHV